MRTQQRLRVCVWQAKRIFQWLVVFVGQSLNILQIIRSEFPPKNSKAIFWKAYMFLERMQINANS